MKLPIQATLTGFLITLTALTASAIPAKRGVMPVEQPDGTTVEVQIIGDERAHQFFTPDGYLLKEMDGYFYYATVSADGSAVSSGIRATDVRTPQATAFLSSINIESQRQALEDNLQAMRSNPVGPMRTAGLFPESRFPAMGEQRAIVILVEYKDVKMTLANPHDYFDRMLNEYGFSDYGGTGCAKEFFEVNSGGNFICDFDLFGPVTLSQNQSYYGGNDWYGNDKNPEMMVVEACQALDGQVDFSEYDRDNDGYVDNIFIFYAGRGEASGGAANTVWPHSWTLSSAGVSLSNRTFDGVVVDRYGCSNEYESGRPDGVGTFVHEFSHVIGLPDLYATSYTSAFTPGAWSALDYGPYNNDGCTPPNYGAFERAALGWMEPVRIEGPMDATLPPITDNVAGIIYSDTNPDEYFLFENRQQTGWDTYIPGHGMLVWHVDYNASVWNQNTVNNTASHQYVDIEEADGSQSEYSRDGDSFPGTAGKTSFGDNTSPSMKRWNGQGFNLPITDIAESNGVITFKVAGGGSEMSVPEGDVAENTFESITIGWEATDWDLIANLYSAPLDLPVNARAAESNTTDPATILEYCTLVQANVNCGRTGSYTFEGLEPMTSYIVEARYRNGLQSSETAYFSGFTGRPTLDRLTVTALDAEDINETGFTARWELLPEASDYLLSVYEVVFGAPLLDGVDFTGYDSDATLPNGWTANTGSTYANAAYSGQAIPALRLGRSGERIQSPEYADGIRGISFWHRASAAAEGDILRVSVYNNGTASWTAHQDVPVVTTAGGAVIDIDDIPAGSNAIRIEYLRTSTKGAVAVDDIEIRHGETYSDEPVAELQNIATGNTDSYAVTGLKSETDYHYTVAATDGTLVSRTSAMQTVQTKPSSGLTAPATPALAITATAGTIAVRGAAAGETITISDLSGRTLSAATADTAGSASFHTSPGFYIVTVGSKAAKVAVR